MRTTFYFIALLMAVLLGSCGGNNKELNERITLWRSDKIPYGTYYAYENLEHIFPDAYITIKKNSLYNVAGDGGEWYDKSTIRKTSYIIISKSVKPGEKQLNAMLRMVSNGGHIFISALDFGENLLDSLRLKTGYDSGYYTDSDSLRLSVINPVTYDSVSFSYPGKPADNYFSKMDSSITGILGKDKAGRANFVRFTYEGGGSIFIHLAPMAFTNFFLLHNGNKKYYDEVLSYLPGDSRKVWWDEYFRYHRNDDNNEGNKNTFSALKWAQNQRGFNFALPLLLLLLIIIYLFESKRKQRIIPVIQPFRNASVDFVKTIGRLYFQRKDNKNLVQKMTAHFMDFVRTKYNIRTPLSDDEFEKRLSFKSGYDKEELKELVYHIRYVQDMEAVPDQALLLLNQKLENFYKHK